jgi:hypothetical protein
VWQIPDAVDTVVCASDDWWNYHPKHVEQFPDKNKLCNFASCWICIGILLGAHYILHISRIRVNFNICMHFSSASIYVFIVSVLYNIYCSVGISIPVSCIDYLEGAMTGISFESDRMIMLFVSHVKTNYLFVLYVCERKTKHLLLRIQCNLFGLHVRYYGHLWMVLVVLQFIFMLTFRNVAVINLVFPAILCEIAHYILGSPHRSDLCRGFFDSIVFNTLTDCIQRNVFFSEDQLCQITSKLSLFVQQNSYRFYYCCVTLKYGITRLA